MNPYDNNPNPRPGRPNTVLDLYAREIRELASAMPATYGLAGDRAERFKANCFQASELLGRAAEELVPAGPPAKVSWPWEELVSWAAVGYFVGSLLVRVAL